MIDILRYLYHAGAARMVENEFCTCTHHIIQHDENAEKCTHPGCRCQVFDPEAICITPTPDVLKQFGEQIHGDVSHMLVGLYQKPLGYEGITDAMLQILHIQARLRLLAAMLQYAVVKIEERDYAPALDPR